MRSGALGLAGKFLGLGWLGGWGWLGGILLGYLGWLFAKESDKGEE